MPSGVSPEKVKMPPGVVTCTSDDHTHPKAGPKVKKTPAKQNKKSQA